MTNKFRLIPLMATLILAGVAIPGASFASGGISGGSSGGGFSGPARAPRQIDQAYEAGKQIFKGRAAGSEKIKYCVIEDGELKKIRGKTLKPYRGTSPGKFANSLYDCAVPDRLALTTMQKDHVPLVLYYLNKRFKLQLQDS